MKGFDRRWLRGSIMKFLNLAYLGISFGRSSLQLMKANRNAISTVKKETEEDSSPRV
jgi:hypothetical protein